MSDPSKELPYEIFLEVLCFVPFREVAESCALVSKEWNKLSDSAALWKDFIYQKHLAVRVDAPTNLTREEREKRVAQMEEEDKGIENAEARYPHLHCDPWKKYFIYTVSYEHFTWRQDIGRLQITKEGKVATLQAQNRGHADAWGSISFTSGVHRWRVRIEGVEKDGFWCALGVDSDAGSRFTYGTKGRITGYSGAGDIFSKEGERGQGTATRWAPGDVITIRLDMILNRITFWINDKEQPSLPTLEGCTLTPWVNGFIPGCSFTLID